MRRAREVIGNSAVFSVNYGDAKFCHTMSQPADARLWRSADTVELFQRQTGAYKCDFLSDPMWLKLSRLSSV